MHGAKQGNRADRRGAGASVSRAVNCAVRPRFVVSPSLVLRPGLVLNMAVSGLAVACLLAGLPCPTFARSTTAPAPTDNPATSSDATPGQAGPARVIFGRALDLDGQRPVRAFSGAFSTPTKATTTSPALPNARSSARITSGFGMRQHPILGGRRAHLGVDMAAPTGSPILSPDAATVQAAGWQGGYGLMVTLLHGNGMVTRYAHLSRIAVAPGQRIGKGAVIGLVGSTGRSTGAHLHYETWVNGQPVNPLGR